MHVIAHSRAARDWREEPYVKKQTCTYKKRCSVTATGAALLSLTAVADATFVSSVHADTRGNDQGRNQGGHNQGNDGRGNNNNQGGNNQGSGSAGRYVSGDFHNHTTCSDGTLSVQKLVDKSVGTFGLDWFVQAGHGGNSARNCTLREDPFEPVPPALNLTVPPTIPSSGQAASDGHGPNQTWVSTLPNGEADIKGDRVTSGGVRAMWKWQEIQQFIYPITEQETRDRDKPVFVGLEQNVPGHEHCSTSITDGQLPTKGTGNANYVA